jgi:hypothetical protein
VKQLTTTTNTRAVAKRPSREDIERISEECRAIDKQLSAAGYSGIPATEQWLIANRQRIDGTIAAFKRPADRAEIAAAANALIHCYPHLAKDNQTGLTLALMQSIERRAPSLAVLQLACLKVRETERFLTIAAVMEALDAARISYFGCRSIEQTIADLRTHEKYRLHIEEGQEKRRLHQAHADPRTFEQIANGQELSE